MPGLDPGIHTFRLEVMTSWRGFRVKPGNDEKRKGGMAEMSEKFHKMGGQVYVEEE
ncbi:MAG: hypothetical protein A49_12210 [Methyloceanibacter sp.]|nr:MAG: hypothetical protein A49_12210 [Methyloceanibacter sp.]